MCGIAGSFALDPRRPVDAERVRRMTRALAHRGPDGERVDTGGPYALGFRRLSILDLSDRGMQPLGCERRAVYSVVNGEIYNWRRLRADLEARGHRFVSDVDAEVVPHLYAEHGPDFVERLDGMFALAVVDADEHRLVLARDRLGKKPLAFRVAGGIVEFASEAKALLAADGGFAAEADPAALVRFLAFGYVPSPGSAFCGLRRLAPATRLVADASGVREERYWSPPPLEARRADGTATAAERARLRDETFECIAAATAARLQADVPLGVFLSGGIDSGLVLAAAAHAGMGTPRAFTIAFADPRHDERALAAATARRFGAEHVVLEARAAPELAIDDIAACFDEPFGDASAYPTLLVSRLAREHVTVALSGDGGDETFAGYRRYAALRLADRLARAAPRALLAPVARAFGEAANGAGGRGALGELKRFAAALALPRAERSLYWSTFFRAPLRARFLHPELLEAGRGADPEREAAAFSGDAGNGRGSGGSDAVARALRSDLLRYLPDDLLVKVDTASMACGLEVRCPLLDHRLVEFACTLPLDVLARGGTTKSLLRDVAADRLPAAVVRARKRGFGVPLADWLRGPLAGAVEERLLGERFAARRILRDGAAAELWARHRGGREDWSAYLWLLLVLDAWFRRFVDRT